MASTKVLLSKRIRKDGKARIFVQVINGKDKKEFPTGYNTKPEHFNPESGLCTTDEANHRAINALIQRLVSEHQTKIQISKLSGENYYIDGKSGQSPVFYEYCQKEVSNQIDKAPGTHRHYEVSLRKINEFDSKTRMNDLDSEWVNRYRNYLLANRKGNDSIYNAFKFLRKMINAGIRDGLITENVFKNVIMPKEPKPQKLRYLNAEELKQFAKAVYRSDMIEFKQCSLWQLYACYSGLRMSDWCLEDLPSFLLNNKIQLEQTKTRHEVIIPLYPRLTKIIQELIALGLPPYNEYKQNDTLKVVAIKAKIPHDLTSHFGRHTFGMYLAESGVGIEVAQKLLGHKSTRETMKYYHLSQGKIADVVMKKLK